MPGLVQRPVAEEVRVYRGPLLLARGRPPLLGLAPGFGLPARRLLGRGLLRGLQHRPLRGGPRGGRLGARRPGRAGRGSLSAWRRGRRAAAVRLRSEVNIELNFPPKLRGARSRLYRRRFLQVNTHFSALFEIYKISIPSHRSDLENSVKNRHQFCEIEY